MKGCDELAHFIKKQESSTSPQRTEPDAVISMNTPRGTILVGWHYNHKTKDTLQTKVERLMTSEYLAKKPC